ncbi:MAG: type II 3-dehydroquinate dehydratase [Solirubrobacteraceae bacterium]
MNTGNPQRIEVMNGVNLDQLHRRPPGHYGPLSYDQLERAIGGYAREVGLGARCFQTNAEHEFVEHLHRLEGMADGVILNPGAWTHYAWAIRDALEICALPAVEVHLSDVKYREEWRRRSVIEDLCVASISGKGPEGYREALALLARELGS